MVLGAISVSPFVKQVNWRQFKRHSYHLCTTIHVSGYMIWDVLHLAAVEVELMHIQMSRLLVTSYHSRSYVGFGKPNFICIFFGVSRQKSEKRRTGHKRHVRLKCIKMQYVSVWRKEVLEIIWIRYYDAPCFGEGHHYDFNSILLE